MLCPFQTLDILTELAQILKTSNHTYKFVVQNNYVAIYIFWNNRVGDSSLKS